MFRVGIGYDIHRLIESRALILGGVKIDYTKGLLGHSDSDVLVHAIMDAILGAMGLPNIGVYFPDNDPQFKDVSSMDLLAKVVEIMNEKKHQIGNIDSVIIAEMPKLNPHIDKMKENLAKVLKTNIENIGLKATTHEGLGDIGEGKAIAVKAVVLLGKKK